MSKLITPKSPNALGFIIMSLPSLHHFVLILKQTLFLVLFMIQIQENGKSKHSLFLLIYNDRSSFNEDTDFEKAKSIIHSLHNRPSTTFLNNTLIDLSELHDLFLTNKKLSPYIPKFEIATIQKHFQTFIKNTKILLYVLLIHIPMKVCTGSLIKIKRFISIQYMTHIIILLQSNGQMSLYLWYTSNIQSTRYITHTMLQPPNQLTYPLHIRTILQKIKNKNGTLSVNLYKKAHFRTNFYFP